MKSAVLTPRSELACGATILLVTALFLLAAPFLLLASLARWVWKQLRLTARDFYQDRHELAAYLFVLAVLAFLIFFYPFQS